MGINVRVQDAPKQKGIIAAQVKLEKDLRDCMRCMVLCQEKVQVKSELFLITLHFLSSQSFYFIQFLLIHILIFIW